MSCLICHNPVVQTRRDQVKKYCSKKCAGVAVGLSNEGRSSIPDKNCAVCGVQFYSPKNAAQYCTRSCANRARLIPPSVRFWNLINFSTPDECWLFTGARDKDGYGLFTIESGKQIVAHRFAYKECHGKLPELGLHLCDNPPCCNPLHIYDGTVIDNMLDKTTQLRDRKEDGSYKHAVLTTEQALDIRSRFEKGEHPESIHDDYPQVSYSTIRSIVYGYNWQHLT